MFLFKNTKSLISRIGLNVAFYGFVGTFIMMILLPVLPEISKSVICLLMVVFSVITFIGAAVSFCCFIASFFNLFSQNCKSRPIIQPNTKEIDTQSRAENHTAKENVFRMRTGDDRFINLTYLKLHRYSPNLSKVSGYGEDNWMYLCMSHGKDYILTFTDNAACGTFWKCTELLPKEWVILTKKNGEYWKRIAFSKDRFQMEVHLTNVNEVRHMLPKRSRCTQNLTDKDFLR